MTCGFSRDHYREILEVALERDYRCIRYDELENLSPGVKACILRHDIDYMPEWSVHLGAIEADLEVVATYFFQICARTYNLRERETYAAVRYLANQGHVLGLHLDISWEKNATWEDVPRQSQEEQKLFAAITGVEPCEIISVHNTHRFSDNILNQQVAGISHTYEQRYFSDIKYLSDSQGWYEGCPCQIFREERYERIQLLTHPYIWPQASRGDFIEDMAAMVSLRRCELLDYLVQYHPVCSEHEERLRRLSRDEP